MKIAQKYSHLNGEEYLIVHHNKVYKELTGIIQNIDAKILMTKESKEKGMVGQMLFSPIDDVSGLVAALGSGNIMVTFEMQ